MKQILEIIVFLFLLNSTGYTQHMSIFGGAKPFDIKSSNLQFNYKDESPNPDTLNAKFNMDNKYLYNLGLIWDDCNNNDKFYWDINGEIFFNRLFGGNIGINAGYTIPFMKNKIMAIVPTINLGYGGFSKQLGSIINKTEYIEINGNKYYDKSLDISIVRDYIFIRPSLNFFLDVSKSLQLRLIGSYLYSQDLGDAVHFSTTDNKHTESVKLSDGKVSFWANGIKSNELPFTTKGFEIKFALSFIITEVEKNLKSTPKEKEIKSQNPNENKSNEVQVKENNSKKE